VRGAHAGAEQREDETAALDVVDRDALELLDVPTA
jgi:hypothetical protein